MRWVDPENKTVQVAVQLDEQWCAFARLVPSRGFAITELRIQPVAGSHLAGNDWRWAYERGGAAKAPPGGIPFRVLRRLRESDLKAAAREFLDLFDQDAGASVTDDSDESKKWFENVQGELRRMRGTPPPVAPSDHLTRAAQIARDYVGFVEMGERHPNKKLAERWNLSPGQVSQIIYRARTKYGLLTQRGVSQGKASPASSLTKKAKDILSRLDDNEKGEA